jgi:hypothetical protein
MHMKRKQLGIKLRSLYWMIGKNSKLSLNNKLLLNKAILKPVWTYSIQLWGSAAKSNLEILEGFQSQVLRIIVNAPWFVPNRIIAHDLHVHASAWLSAVLTSTNCLSSCFLLCKP